MSDKARGARTTVRQTPKSGTSSYRAPKPAQQTALKTIKPALYNLAQAHPHRFVDAIVDLVSRDQMVLASALERLGAMVRSTPPTTDNTAGDSADVERDLGHESASTRGEQRTSQPPSTTDRHSTSQDSTSQDSTSLMRDGTPQLPEMFRALLESVIKPTNTAKRSMPDMLITFEGITTDLGPRAGHTAVLCGGAYVDWERLAALVLMVAMRRGNTVAPTSISRVRDQIAASCAEQLGGRVTRRMLTQAASLVTGEGIGRKTWAEARQRLLDSPPSSAQPASPQAAGDPLSNPVAPESLDAIRCAAICAAWTPDDTITYAPGTIGHAQAVYAQFKRRASSGQDQAAARLMEDLRQRMPEAFPVPRRRGR